MGKKVRHFQKILFTLAVVSLGFSIWYFTQMGSPPSVKTPEIVMTIPEEVPVGAVPAVNVKPFDVRDYGVEGKEIDRMNDYFQDVKREVSDIIARDETLFVALADFKTEDGYKRKLYMALSIANRIKVISPTACARLKKKLSEATSPDIQNKIKQSQEYIVCVPGKW